MNEAIYKTTLKFTEDRIKEINRIQNERGLTAEALIEEARSKDSSLHDLFEWDNSVAAESWRLQQARVIINEVKIIIENKEYYAFENVKVAVMNNSGETSTESKRVYKPLVEIMNTEDLRKQILANALRQLAYWEEQYSKYKELSPIIISAQKVRRRLDSKWKKNKQ